ncbi:hypothetical protein [Gemella sanguinis]|jgi:lipoprotein|uniref:hypothetical protein n=1 Tax=Gemella sanguinis TaxID=84135 RepID=UPI0008075EB9|nr:hypothetical protein [Gemella sanguinis]
MKTKILLSSLLSTAIIISGCSINKNSETKTEVKTENKQETSQNSNSNVVEDSILRNEEVLKNTNINASSENSAFKVSVTGVKITKLFIKNTSDQRIMLSKLEPNTEYSSVLLRVKIKNKTNSNLMINANNSHLLIHDTNEQSEQSQYLATWKETTFLPGAEKEETLLFILKNTKVTDVKNITLQVERPFETDNYKTYEPLSVNITNIQ